MDQMLDNLLTLSLLAGGAVACAISALSLRVLWALFARGPAAADEAFERGEDIRGWLDPSLAPAAEGPREDRRLALAARRHPEFGEVMVEERAPCHVYGG